MGKMNRKSVFILGAGASKEFGLPIGLELKSDIAKVCDLWFERNQLVRGDYDVIRAMKLLLNGESVNPMLHEAWKIKDSIAYAPSIDNFLHTHNKNQHLVDFGKLAIAYVISHAERNSPLFIDTGTKFRNFRDSNDLQENWITKLFTFLVAGKDYREFLSSLENLTFISFNYDRCVQQFFYHSTKRYFDVSDDEASEVLSVLNIIYPYGNIGAFTPTCFGGGLNPTDFVASSKGVKTFTEGTTGATGDAIVEALREAKNVIILGFGFIPLNLELIAVEQYQSPKSVIATAYGKSENSIVQIREKLSKIFPEANKQLTHNNDIFVLNMTCSEIMTEFEHYFLG